VLSGEKRDRLAGFGEIPVSDTYGLIGDSFHQIRSRIDRRGIGCFLVFCVNDLYFRSQAAPSPSPSLKGRGVRVYLSKRSANTVNNR